MQPSPYWTRRSTGVVICSRLFPRHGNSLSHVAGLIDEFAVASLDERVLAEACEFGASPSDMEFVLSRSVPSWREVVKAAARGGHLHVLQWMGELQDDRGPWQADFHFAIDEAARYGHLEIIKWLQERGLSSIQGGPLGEAIHHGHLPVVEWLLHEGVELSRDHQEQLRAAAQNGHLATVQWIHENCQEVDTSYAMAGAAENGDLDMLQWLHQQKSCMEACSTQVMDAAVGGGHFRVVEWLFENCSKGCSNVAASEAAKAGNLPMLQWLHEHYSDRFDSDVMDSAASEGHLETVKWLHDHRSEGCSSLAMETTAENGHLHVLQWLHLNRTEGWTTSAMDLAAASGHLDIVKWLNDNRSEGCSEAAMRDAARNGHLDVLRWLVEHFPDKCRDDLMEVAAWEGYLDIVRYLDENTIQRGSAWGLGAAAKQGQLKTLLVLMRNHFRDDGAVESCRFDAVCQAFEKILTKLPYQRATRVSSLWGEAFESLELFRSSGFVSCVSVMLERALRRGYLPLVQQFMGQRDADEKRKYVEVAANRGNVVFLRWLLEHGTPIGILSVVQVGADRSFGEYVEVAGYLSENERVQLVVSAVTRKCLKLLQWTLGKTRFSYQNARDICGAFQQAPPEYVQWLRENLSDAETRKWGVRLDARQGVE